MSEKSISLVTLSLFLFMFACIYSPFLVLFYLSRFSSLTFYFRLGSFKNLLTLYPHPFFELGRCMLYVTSVFCLVRAPSLMLYHVNTLPFSYPLFSSLLDATFENSARTIFKRNIVQIFECK